MSVTVVRASGTWWEIGSAYGEELRDGIQRSVAFYAAMAPRLGGTAAELHDRIRPYIEAARVHASTRFAELEGMAAGANIGLEDALLINCVEELTNIDACTTAAKGRFLVHAEMWYADQREIGVLVARPDDGPAVAVASCVGFLTGVGANSAGFAQGVQSAFATDERVGVPRVMPSRDALCAPDADAALAAACAFERAGGYSYVVSTPGRHRVLETSAARAEVAGDGPVAVHTNHYISSLAALDAQSREESELRLAMAEAALRDVSLESLLDCQDLLCRDGFRPCRPSDSATIFGFACDVGSGAVCVSDGDPRDARWTYVQVPEFSAVRPASPSLEAGTRRGF
ncbi:MAG: C45 family peptidase [Actinomycetota bacterium]|nr:C45 family peptidase [Actinomycetota bacterium]